MPSSERLPTFWKEREEKGFLTFDSETQRVEFHEIETRALHDLPAFSARLDHNGTSEPAYIDAKDVDAKINALVESIEGGIEGKMIRLVIYDIPRDLFRELDHRRLREYRSAALHFHLDPRRPEARRPGLLAGDGRRRTLEQEVEWFITEHWRPTSSDIESRGSSTCRTSTWPRRAPSSRNAAAAEAADEPEV